MDFAAELRRGIIANDLASVRETEAMMDKAAAEIDRLRAALREIKQMGEGRTSLPLAAWIIVNNALEQEWDGK